MPPRSYFCRGTSRPEKAKRGPTLEGAALSGVRRRSPAQAAESAVAGDRPAREAGGIRGRQERALLADRQREAAPQPSARRARSRCRARSRATVSARSTSAFETASERTLTFFVSRLEYSRWVAASLVPDQSVESCVRALACTTSTPWAACRCWPPSIAPAPSGSAPTPTGRCIEWDSGLRVRGAAARARRRGARAPRRRSRARARTSATG